MFSNEPFGGIIPGPQGAVLATLLRSGTPMTGRQVHRMVGHRAGQQTVQRTLHMLTDLGVVESSPAGRAYLYSANRNHVAITALMELALPLDLLRRVIDDALTGSIEDVTAVILFGSAARGEATPDSDVDLAVIADENWTGRGRLREAVEERYGGGCDVLQYSPAEFVTWAASGAEPVIRRIIQDGIALWGTIPTVARTRDTP